MDGQHQNDTKALTPKTLLSSLECPVCLEYSVGLKIFVCGNCHPALKKCPTCEGPPAKTSNLGLEQLAGAVVVPCPSAENGCPLSLSGSDYTFHKSDCDLG
jgi:hypothetical protein